MKRELRVLFILVVLITGCAKEIDTGETDCRETMSGLVGALANEFVNLECTNRCQIEGYIYDRWKCSEDDTLVCICKK